MILQGDCLEVMKTMEQDSVDAIVTDPPYGIGKGKVVGDESINTFTSSIPQLFRVLKNGGFCAVFTSIKHIPEIVFNFIRCGFSYEWQYICYINNGMVRGRMGFSCYMPVLIFSKGVAKIKTQMRDVCEISAGRELKHRVHPYQKDTRFLHPLIRSITPPGGIVLDPFAGSGSTLIAAKECGFDAIGIEINPDYVNIAASRIGVFA